MIPNIFHRMEFISAPSSDNAHIIQSRKSQRHTFDHSWKHKIWHEYHFLEISRIPQWTIKYAHTLIEKGAWAIISDFLRLYALYTYGGVYADWDVEFVQSIDQYIQNKKITLSFEPYTRNGRGTAQVGAHVMVSPRYHPIWLEIYRMYAEMLWTHTFDILPGIMTHYLEQKYRLPHIRSNAIYYYLSKDVCIVPYDVMYPCMGTRYYTKEHIGPHTLCIHWEHSQYKDNNTSWKNYLQAMRTKPSFYKK